MNVIWYLIRAYTIHMSPLSRISKIKIHNNQNFSPDLHSFKNMWSGHGSINNLQTRNLINGYFGKQLRQNRSSEKEI